MTSARLRAPREGARTCRPRWSASRPSGPRPRQPRGGERPPRDRAGVAAAAQRDDRTAEAAAGQPRTERAVSLCEADERVDLRARDLVEVALRGVRGAHER